jgi:hypothetical protein
VGAEAWHLGHVNVLTWIRNRSSDVVDVFVYIVVLNLAIEYVPSVISESFTLSILTAILLKLALEVVIAFKRVILNQFKGTSIARQKVLWAVALWVLAAGSKILVLELIALVFGDAVSLGGFIPVTGLVICLMLARAGVRWLLYDKPSPAAGDVPG